MTALTGFQGMSDYLVSFIIWSLAVFGTTNIVTTSKMFSPIRSGFSRVPFLGKLLKCQLCFGFWVGMFWGFFVWNPSEMLFLRAYNGDIQVLFDLLFNGAVGSSVAWILHLITLKLMTSET